MQMFKTSCFTREIILKKDYGRKIVSDWSHFRTNCSVSVWYNHSMPHWGEARKDVRDAKTGSTALAGSVCLAGAAEVIYIFDMGGTHPELETADGQKVGSMANLAFRNENEDELTTLSLRGVAVRRDTPWQVEDSGAAYFDNLKAELFAGGSIFIIR